MTEEIKHLAFKGIEKKDQIVLKSFLNLAKNELEYKIVVLKGNDKSGQEPDVLIVADEYEFSGDEKAFESLPCIVLGDDLDESWAGYITNPIQWSDFRVALSQFSEPTSRDSVQENAADQQEEISEDTVIELAGDDLDDELEIIESSEGFIDEELLEVSEETLTINEEALAVNEEALTVNEEVLTADDLDVVSDEVKFEIEEIEEEPIKAEELDDFEPIDHEFELDNMSIDYASHTSSEYLKVVDEVQQYQEEELEQASDMLLVADDESKSSNSSVLVIETNSLDAWDFSETQSTSSAELDSSEIAKQAVAEMADESFDEVVKLAIKSKAGFDITPGEKYWEADNEIIADNASILFVKHQRRMVYSTKEPGEWLSEMQGKKLSKLPMKDDWRPKKTLTAYPISQLIWVNTLMTENDVLSDDLKDDVEYILEKWPHFDLLQLDNVLLKLCSLLFVKPESLNSLVQKSECSRSTAIGLMNACYKEGLLKNPDEVQIENLIAAGDDGVLGMIKGVFR